MEKKVFTNSETINVYELKKKYDNSLILISHTADAISPYTDYIDYLKFDKSIKCPPSKVRTCNVYRVGTKF